MSACCLLCAWACCGCPAAAHILLQQHNSNKHRQRLVTPSRPSPPVHLRLFASPKRYAGQSEPCRGGILQPYKGMAFPVAGLGPKDVTQAVLGQFKASEVTQAMGFLQRQGVLNLIGVKRALGLTSAFHSSMQVGQQYCAVQAQRCMCISFRNTQGIRLQHLIVHCLHSSLPVRCSGCGSGPDTLQKMQCAALCASTAASAELWTPEVAGRDATAT